MAKYSVSVVETREITLFVEAEDEDQAHSVAWDIAWDYPDWDTSDCWGEIHSLDEFPDNARVVS